MQRLSFKYLNGIISFFPSNLRSYVDTVHHLSYYGLSRLTIVHPVLVNKNRKKKLYFYPLGFLFLFLKSSTGILLPGFSPPARSVSIRKP